MGISLLRAVFLVYCLVAIFTTAVSLIVAYQKSRDDVDNRLQLLLKEFNNSLARSVWELDQPQILTIMNGLLKVMDDGVGIAEESVQGTESLGLAGMRERAERVGGEWSIAAMATGGTRVVAKIPLTVTSEEGLQ